MDKLKEEVIRDISHLRQLIKICEGTKTSASMSMLPESVIFLFGSLPGQQGSLLKCHLYPYANSNQSWIAFIFAAQRQVGETSLNDTSSRSHQIIRLVHIIPTSHTSPMNDAGFKKLGLLRRTIFLSELRHC